MSERNPDTGQPTALALAVTVLRNIAGGHWNAGRGDNTITAEQYAAEALAVVDRSADEDCGDAFEARMHANGNGDDI